MNEFEVNVNISENHEYREYIHDIHEYSRYKRRELNVNELNAPGQFPAKDRKA